MRADGSQSSSPRVLIMTVATHREPFIELTEQSVSFLNHTLLVAGLGEVFQGKKKKALPMLILLPLFTLLY